MYRDPLEELFYRSKFTCILFTSIIRWAKPTDEGNTQKHTCKALNRAAARYFSCSRALQQREGAVLQAVSVAATRQVTNSGARGTTKRQLLETVGYGVSGSIDELTLMFILHAGISQLVIVAVVVVTRRYACEDAQFIQYHPVVSVGRSAVGSATIQNRRHGYTTRAMPKPYSILAS